jgi:L-seryl-tRNA(Ser) seleniumtransferase
MSGGTATQQDSVTLEGLGLRPVINASATLTKLGGSVMPPEVVAAMQEGSKTFVDWPELQRAVGRKVAELTQNEAAFISSGAAAGITAAVAAVLAGNDPVKIGNFPSLEGFEKTELIVHRSQRNGYDYAARMTGAKFVEIGDTLEELEAAINERTGAVLWFAGKLAEASPALDRVIEIAHRHGVPVIVDAAAQIPVMQNLWHFTKDLGADLAIFSGGKGLRGPQSSGLVLGRADLIEGCIANGSPNSTIGRPMKVGKEELFGILAAVQWSLGQDEEATLARYEQVVQSWISALSELPGVSVERGFPSEAGQPMARAIVTLDGEAKLTATELTDALWDLNPRIAVSQLDDASIALNPQTLEGEQDVVVAEAIRDLLSE